MAAMTLVTTVKRQDTGVQSVGWNRVVMIGGNSRVGIMLLRLTRRFEGILV